MYSVISSMLVIFLLAIPGFVYGRRKLSDSGQLKAMSGFMMNVILPAIIIQSMQTDFSGKLLISCAKIFAAVFILFFITAVFSIFFSKIPVLGKQNSGLIAFMLFFANTGGIGIPVIKLLLGNEAVFYASAAETAVDLLIFTGGVALMNRSGKKNNRFDFKAFLSPGIIGILFGLALFLTGIRLPQILNLALDRLSQASLAVTMFIIGAQISLCGFKNILSDRRLYIVTAAKLILIPLLMLFTAHVLNCGHMPSLVLAVLFAMPTGSAAVIFSEEYGADSSFAAGVIFLTDVCSLFTIPVIISVLGRG